MILRYLAVTAVIVGGLAMAETAAAQTLIDVLGEAYTNNPRLQSERARLRATDEQLPQALSNWRPQVVVDGSAGKQLSQRDPGVNTNTGPRSVGVRLTQPLFRGFRTVAETRRARNRIAAERGSLLSTEQFVLEDVVNAFSDVVRDRAVLELNRGNEAVVARNLEATQDRFRVGELTRTDVSQAEARLARASADRIRAEGNLEVSRAAFKNVVGFEAGSLIAADVPGGLPLTKDTAREAARTNNPSVITAEFFERAARDDIDLVTGELYPTLDLNGSANTATDVAGRNVDSDNQSITANLTVPLYQSGDVFSRVRAAKQTASRLLQDLAQARRDAENDGSDAFDNLDTARAQSRAFQAEVDAQTIALEGVNQEQRVGSRTVLDVLDAEQELLDAQVNLVRAQRDTIVAAYDLLSAVGALTAKDLGLPVELYDFAENFDAVRNRFFGTGIGGE